MAVKNFKIIFQSVVVVLLMSLLIVGIPGVVSAQRGGGGSPSYNYLSCFPNSIGEVEAGQTVVIWVGANVSGGFSETINVTLSSSPSGPYISNSPLTLSQNANPTYNYSQPAIVEIGASGPGVYNLNFTGTSTSGIVKSCSASFTVSSSLYVDLKMNNSDGPVTLDSSAGGQGVLSWTVDGAQSCNGTMGSGNDTSVPTPWTGAHTVPAYPSSDAFTINNLVSGQTYIFRLTCYDSFGNYMEDTVTVNVAQSVGPPTVKLYCERPSGPHDTVCAVASGSWGILIWETTNVASCQMTDDQVSSPNWPNGGSVNPLNEPDGQMTGNLTTNTVYTLTCTGLDGSTVSDTVLLDTYILPEQPNAPIISVDNSTCGYVKIIMTPGETPPDFDGWYVGWGTDPDNITYELGGYPDPIPVERLKGVIQPMIWYHGLTVEPPEGIDPDRYTYNPEPEINNYYKIAAINTQTTDPGPVDPEYNFQVWGTSQDSVSGAINVDPCNISVSSSDLDVLKIGNKTNNNPALDECTGVGDNDGHEAMPGNDIYSAGQDVTYEINVCNNGNYEMTDITVTDTLENLTLDQSSFQYSNDCGASTPFELISDTQFKLYLDDLPAPPVGDVSVCSITFQAEITTPANPVRSNYKFHNSAVVNVSGSSDTLNSNEYPFDLGVGAPIRRETTP